MAKLIYSAIQSLDGYVADEDGNFDWAAPDEEVHAFVSDLERPVGTYLYGRRMYEVMAPWETDPTLADQSPVMRDFAEIWQRAEKIVYSKTLQTASSAKTRIEREFDPEAVRQLKARVDRDLTIGGPELAAQAIEAQATRAIATSGERRTAGTAGSAPSRNAWRSVQYRCSGPQ